MSADPFALDGRTGIITGGAGTLGRNFAAGFLARGANVVIADRDESAARAAAEELARAHGERVLAIGCDVTSPESVARLVAKSVARFGDLHWLLNNAAAAAEDPKSYHAPFEDYSLAEWRRVMSVNLEGCFLVAQAVGKRMVEQGRGGSIVQTSSIYGVMAPDNRIYEGSTYKGHPIDCPAVYAASKAGLVALTRWLATYWADHEIRVNAVAPGGVFSHENQTFVARYSQRIPMRRMAEQHEILGAMIYLVSDASSYVTGQCLMVDGGLSAW